MLTIATPLNADAAPSLDGGAAMVILSTVSIPVGLMVFPTLLRAVHHAASVTILTIQALAVRPKSLKMSMQIPLV